MADAVVSDVCHSQFLSNSESTNEVNTCLRCRNYEVLLKESLDELNSLQMINKVLQKELLACKVPASTWGAYPDSTNINGAQANGKEWKVMAQRNHMAKASKQVISGKADPALFTRNHFTPLTMVDTEGKIPVRANGVTAAKNRVKKTNIPKQINLAQHEKKHKIIIVGDNHTRGLASNIKHNLNNDFDLKGFVKPGADITTLTSSITMDTKHLTLKDILVFWGGANDVSKNKSQDGLKSLTKLVEQFNYTNITLMGVPNRHDLPDWSCVNNEIATFNTKLKKLMKPYNHVMILETDHDRKFYTRQGMHMNNLGKERTATGVAEEATKILMTQERIINLQWENTKDKNTGEDTTGDSAPRREDQEWEYDITPANQEATPPFGHRAYSSSTT